MIKLIDITRTNPAITRLLKKRLSDSKGCDVWMLDKALKNPAPPNPSVCQMPETAKNKSIGAKIHPKYK